MKSQQNILLILTAVFFWLLTIAGLGLFGLLFFDSIGGDEGILVFVIFILAGIALGYFVFKTVRRRGLVEFLTATNASPDLDNLELNKDSESVKLITEEYYKYFISGKSLCSGGRVKIWGDFRERQLDTYNEINQVKLDSKGILTIEFTNHTKLSLVNPKTIFESSSYLKILEASEVRWEWIDPGSKDQLFFSYQLKSNSIRTHTNSDWKPHSMDILIGQPAVFIFNNE